MQKNFLRKMWWHGRMGHSSYLMFTLQLVNFLLITYNFLIEGNKIFETYVTNLWVFVTITMILYIPISILIGKWHKDTQMSIDNTMLITQDPNLAKMMKGLLNVHDGIASKKEIKEFRNFLQEIEKNDINEF